MDVVLTRLARALFPRRIDTTSREPSTPVPPVLAGWVLVPILLTSLVVGFAVVRAAWPHLERPMVYSDVLVGYTTYDGLDKMRDFRAVWLFLGTSLGAALALRAVGCGLARHGGDEVWKAYGLFLVVGLLPTLYRLGLSVTGSPLVQGPMVETCAAVGALLVVSGGVWRWRDRLSAEEFRGIAGATLCALAIGALAVAGPLMACYRLAPRSFPTLDTDQVRWVLSVGVSVAAAGVVLLFVTAREPATLARRLYAWVLCLQAGLPFLFAVVIPAPYVTDAGIVRGNYRTALLVLLAVAVTACLASLWRRFRQLRETGAWSLRSALSPWCLVAAALLFATPAPRIPRLTGDDFHQGELIVPGQQVRDFGKLPYRDFIPIFGSALGVSAADRAFFSGTLETWAEAETLVYGVGACLLFLAVWWHAGPWAACFVGVFAETAGPTRAMLWMPALLVLAHPSLLGRPRRWLLVWAGLAPLLLLFNPTYGSSAVLATTPVAVVMAWRLGRESPQALCRLVAAAVAVGTVAGCVPAVRDVVTGYVRFAIGQAASNDIAWGIPWEHSVGKGGSHGIFATPPAYLVWELLRSAWLPLAVVAAYCAWTEFRRPRAERDVGRLVLAATTAAAVLILSGYLAGRIDPSGIKRAGIVSFLLMGVWLAAELLRAREHAVLAVALLAAACGMTRLLPTRPEPALESVAERVASNRSIRAADLAKQGLERVNPAELGSRRFGLVFAKSRHLADIREFHRQLATVLKPREPFLNFSCYNAWYFYTGRPVPVHYSSVIYAAGADDQLRMVRDIRANPPPATLISPGAQFDLSPLSVRCYRVFRELALRQVPVRRGPFIFLIDPARATPSDPTTDAARVALLEEAYPDPNFAHLPEVWGNSWDRLQHRFTVAAALDGRRIRDGAEPGASFDLTGLNLTGATADFLALGIDWQRPDSSAASQAVLRVDFIAGDQPQTWRPVARCQTRRGGVLLFPLGSRPAWLLAPRLDRLRVTVENVAECERLRISGVRLLHLAEGK